MSTFKYGDKGGNRGEVTFSNTERATG